MNPIRWFLRISALIPSVFLMSQVAAQDPPDFFSKPPTSFSAEDATFPNAIAFAECARRLLAKDRRTAGPLKYEHLSPEQLPADWFTASQQLLGQNSGTLLVVMGAKGMRGANINPFRIFRRSGETCDVLLSIGAHHLEVLKVRTNGVPDIRAGAFTAVNDSESWYKFDGHAYQLARTLSQPIGVEIPKDPSKFETRPPLLQRSNQDPESILSEARGWLWRQWQLKKPCFVKVTLHSKEGDETTTTYYLEKQGEQMSVTINIHRTLIDRVLHTGPRNTRKSSLHTTCKDDGQSPAIQTEPR